MKNKRRDPQAMVNVRGADPAAVSEARKAINEILAAPHVDNATKVEALKSLHSLCAAPTTITNCHFSSGGGIGVDDKS